VPQDAWESTASGLDYFVLDVFTATRLEGNPLAVFLNPGSLTTETMQAIARETNLSETTFIERRASEIERSEGVLVRIFTTEEELPFAGHPTLGTASLLRAIAPECMVDDTIKLALKVGAVPVRFEPQEHTWPAKGTMTQRDPEFGAILDPGEVAAMTGLDVEDFDPGRPIQIVSTGTAFAIVPMVSSASLARLRVRQDEASTFLRARGARWFYVLGPEEPQSDSEAATGLPQWRARMQFNGGEDPATGSAAGCAIGYLVHHRAVAPNHTIRVRQGVEIARPSEIFLSAALKNDLGISQQGADRAQVTDVRVGGSTILVAKGRLFLP
jgi:trans-2,3-dihydro-3-hydroxyanthranilate isomerase